MGKLDESTQTKVIAKIQRMIESAARTRYGNQMVVRLDPPELGAVTVKLTQRSDQLFARIIPESPEVEAVIRNRVGDISQVLAAAGIKPENVHVSVGGEQPSHELGGFRGIPS